MAAVRDTEPYIGLMSGTSTDGVDGVLADLDVTLGPESDLPAARRAAVEACRGRASSRP